MTQSSATGRARRPPSAVDDPARQLAVIATGLPVVAGSTTWQVLWVLAGGVTVLVARAGRARAAAAPG